MNTVLTPHPSWSVFDSTKIQDYLDCPRQFFYKYILGWRNDTPFANDLEFGGAWHKAMEILYKGGFSLENIEKAYYEGLLPCYREVFPPETDELFDPKTPERAHLGLHAYVAEPANARDLDLFDVIKTEIAGVVPIDPETNIVYKMDLVGRRRDNGRYFVLEHKSKKNSFSRTWTDQWIQSVQVGNYLHALNMLICDETGIGNSEGVIVNGAAFLKTKFDFERVPVRKTNDMMQEHLWMVRDHIDRMNMDVDNLMNDCSEGDVIMRAFAKNPQSCTKYYGCGFSAFCDAWANPLQRCYEAPPGYKVEFWDPLAVEQASERIDLALREYV